MNNFKLNEFDQFVFDSIKSRKDVVLSITKDGAIHCAFGGHEKFIEIWSNEITIGSLGTEDKPSKEYTHILETTYLFKALEELHNEIVRNKEKDDNELAKKLIYDFLNFGDA